MYVKACYAIQCNTRKEYRYEYVRHTIQEKNHCKIATLEDRGKCVQCNTRLKGKKKINTYDTGEKGM